jgi:hypothetical protein
MPTTQERSMPLSGATAGPWKNVRLTNGTMLARPSRHGSEQRGHYCPEDGQAEDRAEKPDGDRQRLGVAQEPEHALLGDAPVPLALGNVVDGVPLDNAPRRRGERRHVRRIACRGHGCPLMRLVVADNIYRIDWKCQREILQLDLI